MESFVLDDVMARLRAALGRDDVAGATAILEALRPFNQADLFSELDDSEQAVSLPAQAIEFGPGVAFRQGNALTRG